MPTLPSSPERLQELGRLIRARRDRLGLTIEEAAELTADENGEVKPTSPTTWARIEKGQGGRAQGRTYARIERRIGWALGACTSFLDDGTQPGLAVVLGQAAESNGATEVSAGPPPTAAELVAEAPDVTHTVSERNGLVRMDVTYADTSEAIFVLAARDDLELTPQERTELARIAAAVWRRNHPQSETDA